MAAPTGVWGIDVGQCALKAIRLEMIDGQLTATAFDFVEHPKILSQPDADPDQLTREALETFLSRNTVKGDTVAISIAGQSGLARFVKLPPVEEKKIADIVRFEAKQQIPFPLEEVVWDFQKIGSGTVTDGFALDTEIGLFAMKRDMINRFLHHFQSVQTEVHIVQMAPLALCNYVAYDLLKKSPDGASTEETPDDETPAGKKRCVVALDIGTDSSNLIITDGEKVIWQRPIPIGGNHFTRALTKDLKLTFAKAEHLKRNAAKSPDLAKILKALKPVLTDFVNEVQRSLGYFTNTHRDAHIAYMVGLGSAFCLPGLQKFLSEKLSLEVRKPTTFDRLQGESVVAAPVFTENLLTFPVAYGLALQGLKLSRLTTNLLPAEIQFDRMIRAKKPWSVAAAAALLLGLGILTGGYAIKSHALGQPLIETEEQKAKAEQDRIGKAILAGDKAVKLADHKEAEAKTKQDEVNKTTADVKSIIAGKDERMNWIEVYKFIGQCVPQPNGANLLDSNQERYWKNQKSIEALQQFLNRKHGIGNSVDTPMDDESLKNLVAVDIEGVHCMYASDLKAFFEKARAATKGFGRELDGIDVFMRPASGNVAAKKYSEELPEGEGWVFELRGHTYYSPRNDPTFTTDFVVNTLVYNLNKFGFHGMPKPGKPWPPPPVELKPGEIGDPIAGKVSHAFLYFCRENKEPQSGAFQYIGSTNLPTLLGVGGGGGGSGMPGAPSMPGEGDKGMPSMPSMPGMPGSPDGGGGGGGGARSSWTPIGLAGSAGSSAGGVGPSSPGLPSSPSTPSGPAGMDSGPGGPASPSSPSGTAAKKNRIRYEFIVYFIWKEPVTSDVKQQ